MIYSVPFSDLCKVDNIRLTAFKCNGCERKIPQIVQELKVRQT